MHRSFWEDRRELAQAARNAFCPSGPRRWPFSRPSRQESVSTSAYSHILFWLPPPTPPPPLSHPPPIPSRPSLEEALAHTSKSTSRRSTHSGPPTANRWAPAWALNTPREDRAHTDWSSALRPADAGTTKRLRPITPNHHHHHHHHQIQQARAARGSQRRRARATKLGRTWLVLKTKAWQGRERSGRPEERSQGPERKTPRWGNPRSGAVPATAEPTSPPRRPAAPSWIPGRRRRPR